MYVFLLHLVIHLKFTININTIFILSQYFGQAGVNEAVMSLKRDVMHVARHIQHRAAVQEDSQLLPHHSSAPFFCCPFCIRQHHLALRALLTDTKVTPASPPCYRGNWCWNPPCSRSAIRGWFILHFPLTGALNLKSSILKTILKCDVWSLTLTFSVFYPPVRIP